VRGGADKTYSRSGTGTRRSFLGDFTVLLPDSPGVDVLPVNGNLTYDLLVEGGSVLPFDSNAIPTNTEIGLNMGGGLKFDAGPRAVTAR